MRILVSACVTVLGASTIFGQDAFPDGETLPPSIPKVSVSEPEQVPYSTFSPYTAFGMARVMQTSEGVKLYLQIPFKYSIQSALISNEGNDIEAARASLIPNRVRSSEGGYSVQMEVLSVQADQAIVYDRDGNQLGVNSFSEKLSQPSRVCILPQSFSAVPWNSYFASALDKEILFVHIPVGLIPKKNRVDSRTSVRAETVSNRAIDPHAPLAYYRFDRIKETDFNDGVGLCEFKNVMRQNNSLFVSGSAGSNAPQCEVIDLNYCSFSVALAFKADSFGDSRTTIVCGGPQYAWFSIDRNPNGTLGLTLNGTEFVRELRGTRISKGKWNTVAVSVNTSQREVFVFVNGNQRAIINLPDDFKCQVLEIDTEETDKVFHFSNPANATAFHGVIDNFMVFRKALGPSELQKLFRN